MYVRKRLAGQSFKQKLSQNKDIVNQKRRRKVTTLIQLSYFINVRFEIVNCALRRNKFHSSAKAQKPAVELIADADSDGNGEVVWVNLRIVSIFNAKTVDNGIKEIVDALNCNTLFFAAVHVDITLGVSRRIKFVKLFFTFSWNTDETFYVLHSVETEGEHFMLFIIESQKVIVIIADEKFIRTDYVKSAAAAFFFLFKIVDVISEIFETDFLRNFSFAIKRFAHCVAYCAGNEVYICR